MNGWQIALIILAALVVWLILSIVFYKHFFKRFYDIVLSGMAIIALSPLLLILTVLGAIKMKGNPFFTQLRPGKINKKTGKEKIFKLIKFRTMTCEKDENGNYLPDEKRLTKYGKILRATSLDELPELFNIFFGQMSIIGPRPLLVQYLPRYSEQQRKRHLVRPGLTGYAQAHGRNAVSWQEKFEMDIKYVEHISLINDISIIFQTIKCVLTHKDVSSETNVTMEEFMGNDKMSELAVSNSCGAEKELSEGK